MNDQLIEVSLQLIKDSIWNSASVSKTFFIDNAADVFLFLRQHSIAAMPGKLIKKFQLPEEVKAEWNKYIFQQVYTYKNYEYNQEIILKELNKNSVPVVVIKGTTASQYYPVPELRAIGDIDLLVKPDDFIRAKDVLMKCGFNDLHPNEPVDRHIELFKDQVHIELHRRFASEKVIDDPIAFDEILLSDISLDKNKLRDPVNGLVLLEHIAQHLNTGIGLRQIIDWMLFVSCCLNDNTWGLEFRSLVEKTGLKELAVNLTRMCQMYLGLAENSINWCNDADESICHELMDYIVRCGNFGHSRNVFDSGAITKIPSFTRPVLFCRYIQKHGKDNWKLCRKYPVLKPLAWIYQFFKYIGMVKSEKAGSGKIRDMYSEATKRRNMFIKLGIPYREE